MQTSRAERNKKKKKMDNSLQNKIWVTLNLSLITAIMFLVTYFLAGGEIFGKTRADFINGTNSQNIEQPQANVPSNTSQNTSPSNSDLNSNNKTEETAVPKQEEKKEDQLLFHFAGDTMFSGRVAEKLKIEGNDFPFQHVSSIFQNDDLSVLNLESPITTRGTNAEDKQYVFESSPDITPYMAKAGIDVVNLANNHILDKGKDGLLDTFSHLDDNKISYIGAGKNKKSAYTPIYVERKGVKIALLGFSRVLPKMEWAAGKFSPGVAEMYNPKLALEAVEEARKEAKLVIVVTHWGRERVTKLQDHQKDLAHALVDAGADLVVGSHPHVLQGIEQYKGKWIAYSLGNFIFTKSKTVETWETAVLQVKANKDGILSAKLIPYVTGIGQPIPMEAEQAQKMFKRVEGLSPGVTITSEGEVQSTSGTNNQADSNTNNDNSTNSSNNSNPDNSIDNFDLTPDDSTDSD
jgi:poly-gamma-glutamate synthesis protein (capsule biosynthesis protein)